MEVYSPVKGRIVNIEEVNDPVFSQKMIGDGVAIVPEENEICSPINGIIESIFPTNHAFIVKSNNKQILVHIGIDTVSLNGEVFERKAEIGDKVMVGDLIVKANIKRILESNLNPTILVIEADNLKLLKTNNKKINKAEFIFSD